jgi:uncharacterized protein YjiS (DUF1127 family)
MPELQQLRWRMLRRNTTFAAAQQKRRTEFVMFIINMFISVGRVISDWRRRQRAYAELMALDDRSLADIGIRRSQIRALIEGGDVQGRELEPASSPETASFWPAQGRLAGLSTKANS